MPKTLSTLKIEVRLGASADIPIRVETNSLTFAPIASIAKSAPARVVTTASHGIPDGWRASIVDAKGMTELNADTVSDRDLTKVAVINATTLDLDGISSLNFRTHTANTGAVVFYAPKDLASYTSANMDVKKRVGGDVVVNFSTTAGTLEIDTATNAVWLRLSDTDTVALSPRDYVFDIELTRPTGIDAICAADSILTVLPQVTTTP